MDIWTFLGIKNPTANLSPEAQSALRVVQSLVIGALTSVLIVVVTDISGHQQVAPLTILIVAVKTFLDSFGHGLAKYLRANGQEIEADAVDEITNYVDNQINVTTTAVSPNEKVVKVEVKNQPGDLPKGLDVE